MRARQDRRGDKEGDQVLPVQGRCCRWVELAVQAWHASLLSLGVGFSQCVKDVGHRGVPGAQRAGRGAAGVRAGAAFSGGSSTPATRLSSIMVVDPATPSGLRPLAS